MDHEAKMMGGIDRRSEGLRGILVFLRILLNFGLSWTFFTATVNSAAAAAIASVALLSRFVKCPPPGGREP